MIILLLGSGGREHALAWKLSQSSLVNAIFVCPGNAGTAHLHKTTNLTSVSSTNFDDLVSFAVKQHITLVVPGSEQSLVDGVESHFRKVGIPVFGPSVLAARMEGSKAFAKAFMARHSIPTAEFQTFSDFESAAQYVQRCGHKVVLKADGLADGKGVLIPETTQQALDGLRDIMVTKTFGAAGNKVVVEELLIGPEISVHCLSDGYTITMLPTAQDHKRIGEGDVGLNTGGMGVYAPAPVATPAIMDQIMNTVLRPTIDGMRKEGFPFVGALFTGLMLTDAGPKVLEYNVRSGDPETEALMLLLQEDVDLAAILLACVEHRLDSVQVPIRPGFATCVILASGGYPLKYAKGKRITIGNVPSGVVVFHAGTSDSGGDIVTSGGRVLAVCASAPTLQGALDAAYEGVNQIHFEGKTFRRDIGHRALKATAEPQGLTYAQAGVSIDAGNALVEAIKPYLRSTRRPGASGEIGGFGGLFDLKAIGYRDPILVSGTDGVGTKLKVATEVGIHDFVGIDLVAMSVNDLLVQGAEPLFFLDYYGCGKLDTSIASQVIKGIADGCRQAGCALIGGETAEMPGMYATGDYDLAGFAVGAVERHLILPRTFIKAGDILLGLASSGPHSNGFSLIRKIIALSQLSYSSPCPWDSTTTLGRALLEPTRIYVKQVLPAAQAGLVQAMAHITGGGFIDNLPRSLPSRLGCFVDVSTWPLPPVFRFIKERGGIAPMEMARTFNNGIGMVVVVAVEHAEVAIQSMRQAGDAEVYKIGEVTVDQGVEMRHLERWN